MCKKIEGNITNFNIVKPEEKADYDPLFERIEKRPEGCLDAQACKMVYWTQQGRNSLYLIVSYMTMTARLNGEEVEVERPVEFFIPAGQKTEDMQWISALMRQSSKMALQSGDVGSMFRDLRDVTWDKGPVRCGVDEYGKPIRNHTSEVAAIAWSFIDILHKRGICDRDGNLLSLEARAANYRVRRGGCGCEGESMDMSDEDTPAFIEEQSVGAAAIKVPESEPEGKGDSNICPECQQPIHMEAGCVTCGCGQKCG